MISLPTTGKLAACFLSLFSFACYPLLAQHRTKDFQITLPEQKVSNSLYNTVLFLDSRPDTSNMGVVQLGAFNTRARVVPEIPMAAQISNVLQAMTDNTAQPGELLFQLRQLSFAEMSGAVSEKGYCSLRAMLYARAGDRYRILGAADTVVLVKAMDVTTGLFKRGSELIAGLMASHLLSTGVDTVSYPYDDIVHIDDLEKAEMPLYQAGSYADGIYET